jgi:hypothetical protein
MIYNLKLKKEIKTQKAEEMVEETKIKPEVLLSRFRSKEDLYRYLT